MPDVSYPPVLSLEQERQSMLNWLVFWDRDYSREHAVMQANAVIEHVGEMKNAPDALLARAEACKFWLSANPTKTEGR